MLEYRSIGVFVGALSFTAAGCAAEDDESGAAGYVVQAQDPCKGKKKDDGDSAFCQLAAEVRSLAANHPAGPIGPLAAPPPIRDELVRLGQQLIFDKELSGNRDTSCMTCHLPRFGTSDGRHLSVGQGATGLGPNRSGGPVIPRNAPPLFNLHAANSLFLDGRVSVIDGVVSSPAGDQITSEMTAVFEFGAISVLPLFPLTSREEMRGFGGNELAAIDDSDFTGIWNAIMARVGAIPTYVAMFEDAYPGTAFADMNPAHLSNAIGAFVVARLSFTNTPWDQFLRGDTAAMTAAQLQGAKNFLSAPCSTCHGGDALSDDEFHNVVLAQIGPGSGDGPLGNDDFGRERVTGSASDRYKFRSNPLRNVELSGPFGHAGQFVDLFDFVFHYSNNADKLINYDASQLTPELQGTVVDNFDAIIANRDPLIAPVAFSAEFAQQLTTFMLALTDNAARELRGIVPTAVPSGLSIDH
jgi:cytochrome c peroxidase